MAEHIKQKIERGKKSVCDSCFHQKVCKGIGNQPCTECSHYYNAADVAPVVHGWWVKRGCKWQCTHCKVLMSIDGTPKENLLNYCPNCGAMMEGGSDG